ncbi:MAG: HAMP domain-containing sensor histidine kinase, partial [Fulvivirga sp.]|nr:HAMP domain-containing sensor histidine kinase [Fulvivirga sp.]
MKLIYKIAIIYLAISLFVFLIGGVITFQVINREVDYEQQRFLKERLDAVVRMIERRDLDKPFKRGKISVTPLAGIEKETKIQFSDTLVMHATLDRIEPHVKLDVIKNVNNRYYKISMYDLIVEEDDIKEGVQESLIKMYLLLTVVVLVLSGITSWWLLKPFNKTLQQIKNFSLRKQEDVEFPDANTAEFKKLNFFLEEMTNKMKNDFRSLKEFTENAAHEMQTPIAIANSKLEILLDADNVTEEQAALIVSAQNSLSRLSKINEALALLTKIENKEFADIQIIDMSKELKRHIHDFDELIQLKSLNLSFDITPEVKVRMDQVLCAILITNLIQNAIKHNYEGGEIMIKLTHKVMSISNSGEPLKT